MATTVVVALLTTLACLHTISGSYVVGVPGVFIPTNATALNYGKPYGYQQPQPQPQYIPQPQPQPQPQYRAQTGGNYGWVAPVANRSGVVGGPAPAQSAQHDWVIGARAHGDTLLFKTIVTKPVGFFRTMAEKNIVFPDPNSKQRINRITSIVVADNSKKGTGGHTQIVSGGVGRPNVELRFKSNNGKKIDLSVNIYGFE